VNTRDKNFTRASIKRRMEQVEASITRYLSALETADRQEGETAKAKSVRLKDKIASLREQMKAFKALEKEVHAAPDQQISLTDPDARAMATTGKGTGMVGYNVQTAVDTKHHLIVAHEVTNVGNDRGQLSNMASQAKDAMGVEALEVLADRGYFKGEEILACEPLGVTPILPKPLTSGAKADGRFGKQDFIYIAEQNAYRCPAGQLLPHHMTTVERGMTLHRYWDLASCTACTHLRRSEGPLGGGRRQRPLPGMVAMTNVDPMAEVSRFVSASRWRLGPEPHDGVGQRNLEMACDLPLRGRSRPKIVAFGDEGAKCERHALAAHRRIGVAHMEMQMRTGGIAGVAQ
jgi:hypothetical protein